VPCLTPTPVRNVLDKMSLKFMPLNWSEASVLQCFATNSNLNSFLFSFSSLVLIGGLRPRASRAVALVVVHRAHDQGAADREDRLDVPAF
jgi:hypothetical protein